MQSQRMKQDSQCSYHICQQTRHNFLTDGTSWLTNGRMTLDLT